MGIWYVLWSGTIFYIVPKLKFNDNLPNGGYSDLPASSSVTGFFEVIISVGETVVLTGSAEGTTFPKDAKNILLSNNILWEIMQHN